MDLLICEKPSQAKAYAEALKIKERGNGFYKGNGYFLTWCIGHVMEMPFPEFYDSRYKKWDAKDLPIIPKVFKLLVSKDKKAQYKIICDLLKKSSRCFICTDFDREGEAIAREVMESVNYSKPVLRVKCSSYEPSDIQEAFKTALPGHKTINKYYAQKGRSQADWLYGMNLSRAVGMAYYAKTKIRLGSQSGIGRVLTPMINICVLREKAIRNFRPKEYYKVDINFASDSGQFKAELQLPEEYQNENGGLDSKADADTLIQALNGSKGTVIDFTDKVAKEYAPLPYMPSTLCVDAEKLNIDLDATKAALQKLYESALVTYPRTDNAYLPKSMLPQVDQIFSHLGSSCEFDSYMSMADPTRVGKCWKDVDPEKAAHHGIVPTVKSVNREELSKTEEVIYDLIVKRFLQQFMEPREFSVREVTIEIGELIFKAKTKEENKSGWHINQSTSKDVSNANYIPTLYVGCDVMSSGGEIVTKTTTKPKRFTKASLLQEMGKAEKYITDPTLKAVLKVAGLGTEATQIDILNKEFKKKSLIIKGNAVHVPKEIEDYMDFIPAAIKSVETTALWEEMLAMVEDGDLPLNDFMNEITSYLNNVILEYQS